MSRIGKAPIEVPANVQVSIQEVDQGTQVIVTGPKGTLTRIFRPEIAIVQEANQIKLSPKNEGRMARSLHGLSRTLLNNMILGVNTGFSTKLEIVGVGYRAQVQNNVLVLSLGYSHPVEIPAPEGIAFTVEANTKLEIKGADKEQVGQVSALIRSKRPPEPYKGKGIRFAGEVIKRKAGKAGKK